MVGGPGNDPIGINEIQSLFTTRVIKNGVCPHLCCSSASIIVAVSRYYIEAAVSGYYIRVALTGHCPCMKSMQCTSIILRLPSNIDVAISSRTFPR